MPLAVRLLPLLLVLASPALAAPRSRSAPGRTTSTPRMLPGTRVTLTPPPGYRESKDFSGYVLEENRSALGVVDHLGPYPEMQANFTESQFAQRNMKLLSEQPVEVDGHQGVLVQVAQFLPNGTLLQWLLLLGDASGSALITASFTEEDSERLAQPLKQALLSARWDKDAQPAPMETGFVLKKTPGLRLARQLQNSLIYTPDGELPAPGSDSPVLMASMYPGNKSASELKAFAETRLKNQQRANDITVESSKPVTLGKTKGHELVARAKDPLTGGAIVIYQLVLVPGGGRHYFVDGRVGQNQRAQYLPHFQAAARSITQR